MPPASLDQVDILGTRGIPANHGGFETFAEEFARYLTGRQVEAVVYCPSDADYERVWEGIRLVGVKSPSGPVGSMIFDLKATWRSARSPATKLVLGYNTALFNLIFVARRRRFFVNMDGIEWRRRKWSRAAKLWFWFNEHVAGRTATGLIADHPAIGDHLRRLRGVRPITMIPYGSRALEAPVPSAGAKERLDLKRPFALVIARPEPENSIVEMVRAWSVRRRDADLVVLGNYSRDVDYQCEVLESASDEVRFVGPIYEKAELDELRSSALFYMYGHTVGGTSPTLVEALGAGSPVLALDSVYSRWVCGPESALYFTTEAECDALITDLVESKVLRERLSRGARSRHSEAFMWPHVLAAYAGLLGVGRATMESIEGGPAGPVSTGTE